MDPLADKILVMSALICLVKLDLASTVCVLLIMIREFAITSIRLLAVEQGRVIAANNWGKLKTVSQMVAIIAIFADAVHRYLCARGPARHDFGRPGAHCHRHLLHGGLRRHLHQGQPGRHQGMSAKRAFPWKQKRTAFRAVLFSVGRVIPSSPA